MKKIVMPLIVAIALLVIIVAIPSYNIEFLLVFAVMVTIFMVNWVLYAISD